MPTITFDITDKEATALTARNGGRYQTNDAFIAAHLQPTLDSWVRDNDQRDADATIDAFNAAADTATKVQIIATKVLR